jgi:hypothetical protein
MYADTMVLPTEDQAEYDSRHADWFQDLDPRTEPERICVERAFRKSGLLERADRIAHDFALDRVHEAVEGFDDRHADYVDRHVAALRDPGGSGDRGASIRAL